MAKGATVLTSIYTVNVSNLGRNTEYPDSGFRWVSSVQRLETSDDHVLPSPLNFVRRDQSPRILR
jgi:hypothetical protein